MITDVSRLRPYHCTIIALTTSNGMRGEGEMSRHLSLTGDIRAPRGARPASWDARRCASAPGLPREMRVHAPLTRQARRVPLHPCACRRSAHPSRWGFNFTTRAQSRRGNEMGCALFDIVRRECGSCRANDALYRPHAEGIAALTSTSASTNSAGLRCVSKRVAAARTAGERPPGSRAALAFETHPCKSIDLHGCSSG